MLHCVGEGRGEKPLHGQVLNGHNVGVELPQHEVPLAQKYEVRKKCEVRNSCGVFHEDGADRAAPSSAVKPLKPCAFASRRKTHKSKNEFETVEGTAAAQGGAGQGRGRALNPKS